MSIYDAAMRYQAAGIAAGRLRRPGVRHRQLARLGGQGHAPARREGRRRAELRAHPPQQPRRHGRAALPVQGRRLNAQTLGLDGTETLRPHRPRGRASSRAMDVTLVDPSRRTARRERCRSRSASTRRSRSTTTCTAASCPTCCGSSSPRAEASTPRAGATPRAPSIARATLVPTRRRSATVSGNSPANRSARRWWSATPNTMTVHWERSSNGSTWEPWMDVELTKMT